MIETVMSFALGFLAASLAALLMLPVLNRRATRLARRRIEGMFPTSMQEIAAERDALRAEFTVAQLRLERKVEAARTSAGLDKQAAGARILEIAALEHAVAGRDAALDARKAEIDGAFARIVGLDRDLAAARSEGIAGLAALTALEDAHREILVDLKAARRERDGIRHDLDDALVQTELPSAPTDVSGIDPAEPDARHAALVSERDGLRASLTVAENALAEALAETGARHRRGQEAEREEAELRSRIADIAEVLSRRDRLPPVGTFPLPSAAGS